jgi:hypothetical protein
MNKNTAPNMPLWAAILASSSIPFFYKAFDCPKDWENPSFDTASIYQFIVDDFLEPINNT